jgi:GT2 family glycosyltransferase
MKTNSKQLAKVSAIIPNYNGLELMKENLPAVLTILRDGDQLVIVDDASTDQSSAWLLKRFNAKKSEYNQEYKTWGDLYEGFYKNSKKTIQVRIFVNSQNQRFAESSNRGVKLAAGRLIFLLNTDVNPHPNLIQVISPYFCEQTNLKLEAHNLDVGQIFAVGCMEIEKNLDGIKGGKNKLWFEKGRFFHSRADDYKTGETAWASGGSAFFDREKWLALGGFDLDYYPAYWEDVDLSYRAKKQGWKVFFEDQAVVDHNHESTNRNAFGKEEIEKVSWKNGTKFVFKNGNCWQKIMFLLWYPYWLLMN